MLLKLPHSCSSSLQVGNSDSLQEEKKKKPHPGVSLGFFFLLNDRARLAQMASVTHTVTHTVPPWGHPARPLVCPSSGTGSLCPQPGWEGRLDLFSHSWDAPARGHPVPVPPLPGDTAAEPAPDLFLQAQVPSKPFWFVPVPPPSPVPTPQTGLCWGHLAQSTNSHFSSQISQLGQRQEGQLTRVGFNGLTSPFLKNPMRPEPGFTPDFIILSGGIDVKK